MKTQDTPQDTPGLGRKIQPKAPEPKPLEKVREGVYKDEKGRMFTDIAPPPSPTIWEAFRNAGLI